MCLEREDLREEQEKLNIELQNILEEQTLRFAALKNPIMGENLKTDDFSQMCIGDSDNSLKRTSRVRKQADSQSVTEEGRTSPALNLKRHEISANSNPKTTFDSKITRNKVNSENRKTFKPKNYTPNLSMPSRTLQLKRQGSLPKLPWDNSGPEVVKEDTGSSNYLESPDFVTSQTHFK